MRCFSSQVSYRNKFDEAVQAKQLAFLQRLETSLASANQLEDFRSQLAWLRGLSGGTCTEFGRTLEDMVGDILALGDGSYRQARATLSDLCIPEDQVYQVAPGADVGAIPPEQLISITGSAETCHSNRTEAVQFGDYVICKGVCKELPIVLGCNLALLWRFNGFWFHSLDLIMIFPVT